MNIELFSQGTYTRECCLTKSHKKYKILEVHKHYQLKLKKKRQRRSAYHHTNTLYVGKQHLNYRKVSYEGVDKLAKLSCNKKQKDRKWK